MPTFFVENSNLAFGVGCLVKFGKFNSPKTPEQIEQLIKDQFTALYSGPKANAVIEEADIYQSLYCLPALDYTLGKESYLLNLYWRGRVADISGRTKV
ncbi:hypothetical protein [Pseudomonas congelans]|uniref:hypothetical protein n=1 Tax=Pseudomonas congelans TaxID=200452 RepID=UPI001BDD33F7|nr:hypothetical protein [Pseudomonas congelans]QVX10835.1 hypothetical protein DBV21_13590 [Pseudomonas congelans]